MKIKHQLALAFARLIKLLGDIYDDYQRHQKAQQEREREEARQAIRDDPDRAWNDRFGVRDDPAGENDRDV